MENKLETRLYNVVGVTFDQNSQIKVRYATDQVEQRERHYLKFGATFAYFAALPKPMTKMDIVEYLTTTSLTDVFGDRIQGVEKAVEEGIALEEERLALALAPKEPKKRGPKPKAKPAKASAKPKKAKAATKSKKKAEKKVEAPARVEAEEYDLDAESPGDWGTEVPILDSDYDDDSVDLSEFEAMAQYND